MANRKSNGPEVPKPVPDKPWSDPELWLNLRPDGHFINLGLGEFAEKIGVADRQLTGHWCKKCKGIWFGYPFEVACPVCGNRGG